MSPTLPKPKALTVHIVKVDDSLLLLGAIRHVCSFYKDINKEINYLAFDIVRHHVYCDSMDVVNHLINVTGGELIKSYTRE